MNYASITPIDIANGTGVRCSLFVSGCTHRCLNCFNQDAWDFHYGERFTIKVRNQLLKYLEPDYIEGITLLGGDPMEPSSQKYIWSLMKMIRNKFGNSKTIWLYTGNTYEDLRTPGYRYRTGYTDAILDMLDVLVDGRFVESLKNLSLAFRGSENQRLIDIPKTLETGQVVLKDIQ